MTERFLDREYERQEIHEIVTGDIENSACIIVAGKSGVGKTSFTKHVASYDSERSYIRVSVTSNLARTLEAGAYLREAAIALDTIANADTGFDKFEQEMQALGRLDVLDELGNLAADLIVPRKVRDKIVLLNDLLTQTGQQDWRKKLYGLAPNNLTEVRDYASAIFKQIPMGLIIENAQNMDEYSANWLSNLTSISKGHIIFLEWTVTDVPFTSELRDIQQSFAPYCSINKLLMLSKLPLNDALSLISDDKYAFKQWLQKQYGLWDGNLIPLVDLALVQSTETNILADSNVDESSMIEDSSAAKFGALSNDARLLYFYVLLRGGQLAKQIAIDCHRHSNPNFSTVEFQQILDELEQQRLIRSSHGATITVRHDSLHRDLSVDPRFVKVQMVAAQNTRGYCESKINSKDLGISDSTNLLFFLIRAQLYLEDIAGVLRSIDMICKSTVIHHSPTVLCDILADLGEICKQVNYELPDQALNRVSLEIAAICIRTRIFSPSRSIFKLLRNPSAAVKIASALLCLGMERHERVAQYCQDVAEQYNKDSYLGQYNQIVDYLSKRHLGAIEEGRKIWQQLQVDMKGEKHPLRPFVLRNAEMFCSTRESIPFLIRSIRQFSQLGEDTHAAYSMNALGGQLLRLNKVQLARSFLQKALEILRSQTVDSLSVENNLAVANVRLGDLGPEIEQLFEKAAIGLNEPFNRLCISNNLTSYYFLCGKQKIALGCAYATLDLIRNRTVASPQVNQTILSSLFLISQEYDDPKLRDMLSEIELPSNIEPDVYTFGSSRNKTMPSFILFSNWYPDPQFLLTQETKVY